MMTMNNTTSLQKIRIKFNLRTLLFKQEGILEEPNRVQFFGVWGINSGLAKTCLVVGFG